MWFIHLMKTVRKPFRYDRYCGLCVASASTSMVMFRIRR